MTDVIYILMIDPIYTILRNSTFAFLIMMALASLCYGHDWHFPYSKTKILDGWVPTRMDMITIGSGYMTQWQTDGYPLGRGVAVVRLYVDGWGVITNECEENKVQIVDYEDWGKWQLLMFIQDVDSDVWNCIVAT